MLMLERDWLFRYMLLRGVRQMCALTRGGLWVQVESGTIVAQVDEVSGMVYFQEDKIEDFGSTQSIERSGPHVLRKWGKRAAVVLVGGCVRARNPGARGEN